MKRSHMLISVLAILALTAPPIRALAGISVIGIPLIPVLVMAAAVAELLDYTALGRLIPFDPIRQSPYFATAGRRYLPDGGQYNGRREMAHFHSVRTLRFRRRPGIQVRH